MKFRKRKKNLEEKRWREFGRGGSGWVKVEWLTDVTGDAMGVTDWR
jgi:hypothetical protein